MPIYEYECDKCRQQFEEIVLSEDEVISCPKCGSKQTSRLISSSNFRTGGPIVSGSPSSGAITSRGTSPCAGCTSKNCSTCSS